MHEKASVIRRNKHLCLSSSRLLLFFIIKFMLSQFKQWSLTLTAWDKHQSNTRGETIQTTSPSSISCSHRELIWSRFRGLMSLVPGASPESGLYGHRGRLTEQPPLPSSPSVCSLTLPRRTNALSAATWERGEECGTCARSWQRRVAAFTQELSPTGRALFWQTAPATVFSPPCLPRLGGNWVGLQTASLDLSLHCCLLTSADNESV